MKKNAIKVILFMLAGLLVFSAVNRVFGVTDNVHTRTIFRQFYSLPKGTIDAVFIGGSDIHEFVVPSVIYDETGISTYDLATGNMPVDTYSHLVSECERVQDPEVYFISLRTLASPFFGSDNLRRVADNMEWSSNRLDLINYVYTNYQEYRPEACEPYWTYLFPLAKYHTRWHELNQEDFSGEVDCFFGYVFNTRTAVFDKEEILTRAESEPQPIIDEAERYLNDLLDYCDGLGKPVVFIETPCCKDEATFAKYRYVEQIVEARGYTYWNMNHNVDEMGIDYSSDWGDGLHVNSIGAQKVSSYLGKVLRDEYGLEDHRGDKRYKDYVEMSDFYNERFQEDNLSHVTDFNTYLNYLAELDLDKYSVFMAVKDIQGFSLTEEMTDRLKTLGFDQADTLLEWVYHSFVGVLGKGDIPGGGYVVSAARERLRSEPL